MSMGTSPLAGVGAAVGGAPVGAFRHRKRSFLRLPVPIDVGRLLNDFAAIPSDAWATTHWEAHFSSSMLLLRGGKKGTAEDFVTSDVSDQPVLERLPYIRSLLAADGPFGDVVYAFIFRMRPFGMATPHTDDDPAWQVPFRVHIPITTCEGSLLLANDQRGQHFDVGEVWTFDNQGLHAVVNGPDVRTHLIIDVLPNEKLGALLGRAQHTPGEVAREAWRRVSLGNASRCFSFAYGKPLSTEDKTLLGLAPNSFACRVRGRTLFGRLTRIPLRAGDVVVSVNGVERNEHARTALDHLFLHHGPGERVEIEWLRDGKRQRGRVLLVPHLVPRRVRRVLREIKHRFG